MGRPLASTQPGRNRIRMFADGGFPGDYSDDSGDGSGGDGSDPYAYDSPSESTAAIDSGAATPTSSGNVSSADPLPNTSIPIHYFGGPGGQSGQSAASRYIDYTSNPSAHGANPKSTFLRRLGGALIDTAGTWGAGFGVPRGVTHHLANDVRFGPEAAHAQEDYYQNLPLMRDAAAQEDRQRQLDQQRQNQDLQRQYQLLQLENTKDYRDELAAGRQASTRQMAEARATTEGYQPLPQPLPALNTTEQLPGTDISLPLTTGGMSPEQQIPKGWAPRNLPAAPGLPAERGMVPPPHNDWPTVSPEMADQLTSLGVKGVQAGQKVDPRVYDSFQATLRQQIKEPPLAKDVAERTKIADQQKLTGRDRTAYIATGKFAEYPPSYVVNANIAANQDPQQVKYWADKVQVDAANWGMVQGDKALSGAVRAELSRRGVNINRIDAQTRDSAKFAQTLEPHITKIQQEIADLDKSGRLGAIAGRWNEFMTGKVGSGDPAYEALRVNMGLFKTALGRVHGGARGGASPYMIEHFNNLINSSKMDAATLKSGVDAAADWVHGYANMAPGTAGATGPGTGAPIDLSQFERR